jgi:NTP pyrophosphatase (non-canonical NTP hydrolase)
MMDIDRYQDMAAITSKTDYWGLDSLVYFTLGLTGEAGEVADKIKKIYRDKQGVLSPEDREAIISEMGDVLWYIAMLADELDVDLSVVAHNNITKLRDRQVRGTLRGSGDDR